MVRLNENRAIIDYESRREAHSRRDVKQTPRTEISIPEFMQDRERRTRGDVYNSDGDSFRRTTRQSPSRTTASSSSKKPVQRKSAKPSSKKGAGHKKQDNNSKIKNFILGLSAAAVVITGGMKACDSAKPPEANYTANQTVVEIAQETGTDTRAIILANNLYDENDSVQSIVLPKEYKNTLQDEISKLEEKLEKTKPDDKKYAKLKEELESLQDKQKLQNELAVVYVDEDEKYAYIIPNDYSIPSEQLKDAFGIEDGVIRKYNGDKLTYTWGTENPEYGYYRDYTGSPIPYSGIKIPFDELNKTH